MSKKGLWSTRVQAERLLEMLDAPDQSDLKPLIDHIDSTRLYRWYPVEIIAAINQFVPEREDLIRFFDDPIVYVWYKDEILERLLRG